MKRILSFLMSLLILISPALAAEGTDREDMKYFHYDEEYFTSRVDRMIALAAAGDAEAVIKMYDELYGEYLKLDSLAGLAMLNYDRDCRSEYWTAEYEETNTLLLDMEDEFFFACRTVLNSPCAESFAEYIGEDAARAYRSYAAEEASGGENLSRELRILDEYYLLLDGMDGISFSYEGESWDLEKLYGFPGTKLYYTDFDTYAAVEDGVHQAITEAFAPLYIELTEIWTEEARANGYDSFTDYAYEAVYRRDYTPAEAQRFCDAVKPIAREYFRSLYYSDMFYAAENVTPVHDAEELLAVLGEYLPRIDPSLAEPWEQLTRHELYDLGEPSPGRYSGSYTTTLSYWNSPFLFSTLSGSCDDLIGITHEFGHFADFWFNPMTNILLQTDDLDLSEVHSNGLQALFTAFYPEIFAEGADIAAFLNLADLLESVIDGCIFDEFQRRVLADPEGLTAERLNDLYLRVCAEYGCDSGMAWNSDWVTVSHNFEYPLYYISYAVSAMAALQLWDMAQDDFDAAAATYMDILRRGSWRESYFQVLRACGLRLFTEKNAVEEVCRPVLDTLCAWDREASQRRRP